jgi:phage terminase large subunit-like protein
MTDRHDIVRRRLRAIELSRESLIDFTRLMMPAPDNADDPDYSLYDPQKFHRVIGVSLEEIERRKFRRLMINVGPRMGKTTLASNMFPAWYIGRHPTQSIIVATYNEHYSWDLGRKIRDIIQLPQYAQVFPKLRIKKRSAAVNRIETADGGIIFCVGRGSAITGRGADVILLDDPIKDRREADSVGIRDGLWTWYTQVLRTRLMTRQGAIVIIQTRWTEDDLVGRLIDPLNSHYVHGEAKLWRKVDLPALAEEGCVLGRKVGEALWPERFDEAYLAEIRSSDARGFMALYQGRPSPQEGAFFRADDLMTYKTMSEAPPAENLRFYGASDHAVSLAQNADKTCLMIVGVDTNDHLWIMPDLVWQRTDSNGAIEGMLVLMDKYKPQCWWAETGQILKSIGPFLRKRMLEKHIFCMIDPIAPHRDKLQRAQAIQARSAMKMVHFPLWTRWFAEAQDQVLKFNGSNYKDDFVDTLSLMGLGLAKMRPRRTQHEKKPEIRPGTFAALWRDTRRAERDDKRKKALQGWL